MSLSALPISLAVPPVNLLLACVAGLFLAYWHPRTGLAVAAVALGVLFLLATPFVSHRLIAALEADLPLLPADGAAPRAIVVLSGDVAMGAAGDLSPGALTLERERMGAALARATGLPVLVAGGTLDDGRDTLSAVMARSMATDFLVPVRWTEAQSRDTWENAANSAAILRANGIGSIYLVTHAWHMRRALIAFAPTGLAVTAAPVRLDGATRFRLSGLVPRATAWLDSYYALHEWIGCAYYAWRRWTP